jgi:hypothetical protein
VIDPGGCGHFLNVDVELEITVRHDGHACFELEDCGVRGADETVRALTDLVSRLDSTARQAWDRAASRVFDIGVGQGTSPEAIRISARSLAALSTVGADLGVTTYADVEVAG